MLVSSANAAIAFFASRDLLGAATGPVSGLWDLPPARRIVAKQNDDGSWRYPGGNNSIRSRRNYHQLETFRQVGILVEEFAMTRAHPAIEAAAEFLFSFQTGEGDFFEASTATSTRPPTSGPSRNCSSKPDTRRTRASHTRFLGMLSMRQNDGGWTIPMRTVGIPFSEFVDSKRHPHPISPTHPSLPRIW